MTAGNTGPTGRRWTDADGISPLQQAVIAALQDSPYKVIDTEGGFEVELPDDDEQCRGVLGRSWRHRELGWVVKERPGSYSVTDVAGYSQGSVGLTGFSGSFSKQVGRVPSFTRTTIWALTDTGAIERVAGFRFNTREVRDVIRLAARQLGLKERLPQSVKVMIAAIAVSILLAGALTAWMVTRPARQGPPAVPDAKTQLIGAAHDVVTATRPSDLHAGFAWRSCDGHGFPYRGELTLYFGLPDGPQHVPALNAMVGQLRSAGWADGLPPRHRDPGGPLVPDEVATLHRGDIAAHVRRGNPVNAGPLIRLEAPCGDTAGNRSSGSESDVTAEVR